MGVLPVLELFPDQSDVMAAGGNALREYPSVLIQASCGSGKTVIATGMIERIMAAGKTAMFACHRHEILEQTAKTFQKAFWSYAYISSGKPRGIAPVYIATIQTLRGRVEQYRPDYFFADEAHLSASATWSRVIKHYLSLGTRVIGLSASPERLDGRGLGDLYQTMVQGPSIRTLIERKRLSEYVLYAPNRPDVSQLHTLAGDFKADENEALMDRPTLTGDALSHWSKRAKDKRTIIYCTSIKHSQHVADTFRAAGIAAAHVDGETPKRERAEAIADFGSRHLKVITNAQLWTEGLDLSAIVGYDAPIEACVLLRPTQSLALYIQMTGRALRRKDEAGVILDHAGLVFNFGMPCADRAWSLEGRKRSKRGANAEKPQTLSTCPECYATFAPVPICPQCGFAIQQGQRKGPEQVAGELVQITSATVAPVIPLKDRIKAAKTREALEAIARERGWKPGAVDHMLRAKAEARARYARG